MHHINVCVSISHPISNLQCDLCRAMPVSPLHSTINQTQRGFKAFPHMQNMESFQTPIENHKSKNVYWMNTIAIVDSLICLGWSIVLPILMECCLFDVLYHSVQCYIFTEQYTNLTMHSHNRANNSAWKLRAIIFCKCKQ